MRTRPFGAAGAPVPVIGQGTWMMERDRNASIRALRLGLDLGMTHIDTAEMYGSGLAEEIVGEAVRGRRDEAFLASKVLASNASYEGTLRACERSLKRLRTERLDLYLLHWRGSLPLEPAFRAFERLQEEGKIRAWGVSNFDVSDLEDALKLVRADRIACNQVLYHLKERAVEHEVSPWCARHGIALVAYSPFGEGDFPAPTSAGGLALAAVAASRGATPRQAALAFLVRDAHVFTIPKSSHEAHVRENAAAGDLELTAEDILRIDAALPRGPRKPLPTL